MGRKKKIQMDIINPNSTGIDVGSKSHFVAVGQGAEDVREFGVYADDLPSLCLWLKDHDVITIIADICKGNLNTEELAKHRHYNCRKSEEEIAKALRGK